METLINNIFSFTGSVFFLFSIFVVELLVLKFWSISDFYSSNDNKNGNLLDLQVSDKPYCGPVHQYKEEKREGRTIQPLKKKQFFSYYIQTTNQIFILILS